MPGSLFPTTRRSVVLALASDDAAERSRAFDAMVAGTCVGAFCGWATKRYGVTRKSDAAAGVAMILLFFSVTRCAAAGLSAAQAEVGRSRMSQHAQTVARADQPARARSARRDNADEVGDSPQPSLLRPPIHPPPPPR